LSRLAVTFATRLFRSLQICFSVRVLSECILSYVIYWFSCHSTFLSFKCFGLYFILRHSQFFRLHNVVARKFSVYRTG